MLPLKRQRSVAITISLRRIPYQYIVVDWIDGPGVHVKICCGILVWFSSESVKTVYVKCMRLFRMIFNNTQLNCGGRCRLLGECRILCWNFHNFVRKTKIYSVWNFIWCRFVNSVNLTFIGSMLLALLQDHVDKDQLLTSLMEEFAYRTCQVGVDVNRAIAHPHTANIVQFVCGLGARKAAHLIKVSDYIEYCIVYWEHLQRVSNIGL